MIFSVLFKGLERSVSCFWAWTCTDWLMIVSPASPGLCSGLLLWPPCPVALFNSSLTQLCTIHKSRAPQTPVCVWDRVCVSGKKKWWGTAVFKCMNLIHSQHYCIINLNFRLALAFANKISQNELYSIFASIHFSSIQFPQAHKPGRPMHYITQQFMIWKALDAHVIANATCSIQSNDSTAGHYICV